MNVQEYAWDFMSSEIWAPWNGRVVTAPAWSQVVDVHSALETAVRVIYWPEKVCRARFVGAPSTSKIKSTTTFCLRMHSSISFSRRTDWSNITRKFKLEEYFISNNEMCNGKKVRELKWKGRYQKKKGVGGERSTIPEEVRKVQRKAFGKMVMIEEYRANTKRSISSKCPKYLWTSMVPGF